MKKYNVIYIHSHDTGRYIQPYGHAVATPKIQEFAEEGVLFRQAFCVNPTCSPSRAALLTGQYPHNNGMLGLAHRGFSLYDYGKHMVHMFNDNGYDTMLAGVQHVTDGEEPWKTIGYQEHIERDDNFHNVAADYITSRKDSDKPFFMAIGFQETHREFPEAHPSDNADYCLPPAPLPDTPETREDMARFKESARVLDKKMGTIFDAVKEAGIQDNTIIICTTDHGIAFPRMKCNLHDSGIGIMLIIKGPEGFTGGKCIQGMVSHIDIFPTLCEILDVDKPEWLEGVSFMPLVNDDKEEVRDNAFFTINVHASYEPMRALRTTSWKYIKRYKTHDHPVMSNCDAGPSKTVWMDNKWIDIAQEGEMLYDLTFDPNETRNLVNSPAHKEILEKMRSELEDCQKKSNDPLLNGVEALKIPEDAKVNPNNLTHPGDPSQPWNTIKANEL